MTWIAVDAGTSLIKAVAFDDSGQEIATARQKTRVLRPSPGFAEQSMDEVWNAVAATVRMVATQLRTPIKGISVTSQGDGCWLIDSNGNPVGNTILWNDARATSIVNKWKEHNVIEQAFRISGSVPYAGLQSAIFNWLRTNDPNRLASARFALSCNGWIFSRLTGQYIADYSDASNPFSDVKAGCYSPELIRLFAAEEEHRLLPPIASNDGVVSQLTKAAAETLGLEANIPVVMAPYDIVSTSYGAGASLPKQACLILGTTICAETITSTLDLDGSPIGTTIALNHGQYLRAMPTLTGCETLEWATKILGLSNISELEVLAAKSTVGAEGLIFLPYLSPAGERAPFLEPRARGSFHGLNLSSHREAIARSIYEGLSCAIKECLGVATEQIEALKVCGGGARSDLWCQMIADTTGVTVERPTSSELGARGAFLFALYATGTLASIAEGNLQYPNVMDKFVPSPDKVQRYEAQSYLFYEIRNLARKQWELGAKLS